MKKIVFVSLFVPLLGFSQADSYATFVASSSHAVEGSTAEVQLTRIGNLDSGLTVTVGTDRGASSLESESSFIEASSTISWAPGDRSVKAFRFFATANRDCDQRTIGVKLEQQGVSEQIPGVLAAHGVTIHEQNCKGNVVTVGEFSVDGSQPGVARVPFYRIGGRQGIRRVFVFSKGAPGVSRDAEQIFEWSDGDNSIKTLDIPIIGEGPTDSSVAIPYFIQDLEIDPVPDNRPRPGADGFVRVLPRNNLNSDANLAFCRMRTFHVADSSGQATVEVRRFLSNGSDFSLPYSAITNSGTYNGILSWAATDVGSRFVTIPFNPDPLHNVVRRVPFKLGDGGCEIEIYEDRSAGIPAFRTTQWTADENNRNVRIAFERIFDVKGTLTVDVVPTFQGVGSVNLDPARPEDDVDPMVRTITWADGDGASKFLDIPIVWDDNVSERDEGFRLRIRSQDGIFLSEVPAVIYPGDAGVTIRNAIDPPPPPPPPALPIISISGDSVTERRFGRVNANVTISLSAPAMSTIDVAYSTSDGTANAGSDYIARSATVRFLRGQQQRVISISVLADRKAELEEFFNVQIDRVSVGSIGKKSAVVKVSD